VSAATTTTENSRKFRGAQIVSFKLYSPRKLCYASTHKLHSRIRILRPTFSLQQTFSTRTHEKLHYVSVANFSTPRQTNSRHCSKNKLFFICSHETSFSRPSQTSLTHAFASLRQKQTFPRQKLVEADRDFGRTKVGV
jgi:hypothetical protein